MPIGLTTGVPGAGKTLYTVSELLPKYLAQELVNADKSKRPRRLCIGGVPDLLLPHEPIAVPEFDPEAGSDIYRNCERKPGQPPITHVILDERGDPSKTSMTATPCSPDDPGAQPLVHSADNWWLWCMPGDVIVVDECQRLFRPMPAGRKIPRCIAKLETHRHYGVDFELITQHPQLLHVNVRNLVDQHRHVRRLYGRGATIVYEWDHCTHPDRTKNAVKRPWFHNKKAFGLYKSAELHTKHRHPLGYVMWALFALIPATGYAIYSAAGAQANQLDAARQRGEVTMGARPVGVSNAAPDAPAPLELPAQMAVAGGYCIGEKCVCWAKSGFRHGLSSAACKAWLDAPPVDYWKVQAPRTEPEPASTSNADPTQGG